MAMAPLDAKGKKALAYAAFALATAVGYAYSIWWPVREDIHKQLAHADTVVSTNAIDSVVDANNKEARFRAELDSYTTLLIGLRRLVPTVNEVPALVDLVSTDARKAGLELSEFAQDGTLVGDDFDIKKYKFGVIGPFHKIAEFLTSVASGPQIIVPINVSVGPPSRVIDRKPRSGEAFVEVKFGVLTYVAKTAPPVPVARQAAAAAPAKPGGN